MAGRRKKMEVREWVMLKLAQKPMSLTQLDKLFRATPSIDAVHATLYAAIRELHGVHPKWPDSPRRIYISDVKIIKGRTQKIYSVGDLPDVPDAAPSQTYAAQYARRKRLEERAVREAEAARKEAARKRAMKRPPVMDELTIALFRHRLPR
ncbi:MAG TPA: hypothetical protein VJ840_18585 [Gemmatimonadaceae bacterium]|nr:hypothetical protein [Gemmatimonadaceae bacterium]